MSTFDDVLIQFGPSLRRRANTLAARHSFLDADDLMQDMWEASFKQWAWVQIASRARLFHILGQRFVHAVRSHYGRNSNWSFIGIDDVLSDLHSSDDQYSSARLSEVATAIRSLRPSYRDALQLVALGFDQSEIAEIKGFSRARAGQLVAAARCNLQKMGHER